MRKLILIFSFITFSIMYLAGNANADRTISLPYSTDFTTNNISDLVLQACGGTVTYSSNGYSGGAVKITPPTSACAGGGVNGGTTGIGWFGGFSVPRINIRFLIKVGPTYTASHRGYIQNKFVNVHGTGGSSVRKGILTLDYDSTGFTTPGVYPEPTNWTVYRSPGTINADHVSSSSPFKIYDNSEKSNVWVCFEYEINLTNETARLIITQANGTTTEIATASSPGGLNNAIMIGGYYNGYSVADDGNWLLIDNLSISATGYIGPPSGFASGGSSTEITVPTGLKIIGQ
jgi:hypothetical protein